MSEFKTDKLTPRTTNGAVTIGESGDTIDLSNASTVSLPAASVTAHVTTSPTGPSGEKIFFNNEVQLDNSYSIPAATNSMTVGPITVPTGVIVTVPSGSTWVVI